MGIQSASATFTRFHVEDPVKKDFWKFVEKALQEGSFRSGEEDRAEAAGFASWDDLFDSSFDCASYHKAEYVAFQFRVDRRKVPAVLLKQHFRAAVQRFREENGNRWPARQEKQRLREEVVDRLLARSLPHPSCCEVVWNTRKGWLLVGTRAGKMLEANHDHLESHLRIHPVPLYHLRWALRLLSARSPEAAALAALVSPESSNARDEGRFLGYEFLTWLWFHSEDRGGRIELEDGRIAEFHPGERMALSRPDDGRERVVCMSPAVSLEEARTALQRGKLVEEVQIFLRIGENEYSFRLDTDLASMRSLRTPTQMREPGEEDVDGRFLEKMFFIEEVFDCLDSAYLRFLTHRLGKSWESTIRPRMNRMLNEAASPEGTELS
jgi:DNA recombination-dependent growth factor C